MKNLNQEKNDVVSVILNDHDLLDAFADTLKAPVEKDFFPIDMAKNSLGRFHPLRWALLKRAKDFLNFLSNKIQILAILAEYHFKKEEKKVKEIMYAEK